MKTRSKKPVTSRRLLQAVKSLLVTRGWTKHRAYQQDRTGRIVAYCLTGALSEVASRRHAPTMTRRAAEELLRDVINVGRPDVNRISLVTYNDQKARRKAHVLKTLDDAIAKAAS